MISFFVHIFKSQFRAGEMAQVVACLPSKQDVLSSNPVWKKQNKTQ
jgi:hypothetical protein